MSKVRSSLAMVKEEDVAEVKSYHKASETATLQGPEGLAL